MSWGKAVVLVLVVDSALLLAALVIKILFGF